MADFLDKSGISSHQLSCNKAINEFAAAAVVVVVTNIYRKRLNNIMPTRFPFNQLHAKVRIQSSDVFAPVTVTLNVT